MPAALSYFHKPHRVDAFWQARGQWPINGRMLSTTMDNSTDRFFASPRTSRARFSPRLLQKPRKPPSRCLTQLLLGGSLPPSPYHRRLSCARARLVDPLSLMGPPLGSSLPWTHSSPPTRPRKWHSERAERANRVPCRTGYSRLPLESFHPPSHHRIIQTW